LGYLECEERKEVEESRFASQSWLPFWWTASVGEEGGSLGSCQNNGVADSIQETCFDSVDVETKKGRELELSRSKY